MKKIKIFLISLTIFVLAAYNDSRRNAPSAIHKRLVKTEC